MVALNGKIKLHIWLDRNSVEVFADNGLVVLTDQIFPDAPIERVGVSTTSGKIVLDSLQIHTLKSVHNPHCTAVQTDGRSDT
ncbi:Levanase precursor [compost metagenome]